MTAGEFQHLWRLPTWQDLPFCLYKHYLVVYLRWLATYVTLHSDFEGAIVFLTLRVPLVSSFWRQFNIRGVVSRTQTVFSDTPAVATNCLDLQLSCERVTFPIYQRSKPLKPARHLLPEFQNQERSRTEHEDEVTYQRVIWAVVILKAGLWELLVDILAAVPLCL